MKRNYKISILLGIYGLVANILLEGCNTTPVTDIPHGKDEQIIENQALEKQNNKRYSESLIEVEREIKRKKKGRSAY
ncbi:MAG: hypothetical protein BGO68_00735 [Candidatus Amoebophilus sp. 36-38]|nr:MAG: hypothetical protein BGO68_00735 [Candidatus Amoebophilus sp. 36-38]